MPRKNESLDTDLANLAKDTTSALNAAIKQVDVSQAG